MPNCDFYATGSDIDEVISLVFALDDVAVFESYSPFDMRLQQFHCYEDVADRYPEIGNCSGNAPSVLLMLCPLSQLDGRRVKRIKLKPSKASGATFREAVEGWGLIQLYIGGIGPKGIIHSHTNHNSEARARTWERTNLELGPVDAWDFKLVSSVSSRINRNIREKLAVAEIDSRPVLKDAKARIDSGTSAI